MKRVAAIFTGGTISMELDPAAGGLRPTLDGAAILARAPVATRIAQVDVIDWGKVPASHLGFEQILDIARVIDEQLRRPEIDGVVLVQGTDTIEETAFAFDLLVGTDKPLVVTGAMRDASSAEYDGPRNLADAVACAASETLRGQGTVVVMAGLVLAAEDVVKSHSTAQDTFQPRDGDPRGTVHDGTIDVEPRAQAWERATIGHIPSRAVEDVYLVTAAAGVDGQIVRGLAPLRPRGLVVAATGSGNTHHDLLAAARDLMAAGTLVCLTTRCPGGTVDPVYAFPGGGATWRAAGAIESRLDGPKTRVALALGLAAGLDGAGIQELIGPRP